MDKLKNFYWQKASDCELKLKILSRQIIGLSFGRLLFFVLFVSTPIILKGNLLVGIGLSLVFLVIFLFLIKKHIAKGLEKKYFENLQNINREELKALGHDFSAFPSGEEFIDHNHINSFDLDLFGKGSLFQYLNRTVTLKGSLQLARMLQSPPEEPGKITELQNLVRELAEMIEWRQSFMAYGKFYAEDSTESKMFEKWGEEEFSLKSMRLLPLLMILLPVLSLVSVIYWALTGNFTYFILSGLVQFGLWMAEKKNTANIYRQFGKRAKVLKKYARLFQMIESVEWKSPGGRAIIDELKKYGLPSEKIGKLSRMVATFDNRNNFFVGLFGNMMFLWDIVCSYRLVKWHVDNKTAYVTWNRVYSFFDALISLANFSYNNPGYCYPQFSEGGFEFSAKGLGHPLINPGKRIVNDFELSGSRKLIIVTGANMAGKSTFLRTIGVNMILGQCGATVCAAKMDFTPVKVYTNMRTTDSLFDDESYFFAELKRIKFILDEIEKGMPVLIILDEMLKGTNSVDKLSGSRKLLKKLVEKGTPAIVATHDLKLTNMVDEYPNSIQNKCFEIAIENDEMRFNYLLQDGTTQTMNATFMMKKMGIITD